MKYKVFLVVAVVSLFWNCKFERNSPKNEIAVTISCDDNNYNGFVYLFRIHDQGMTMLDSAFIGNGKPQKIQFEPVQTDDMYSLRLYSGESISLVLKQGEKVEINLKSNPYSKNYSIIGSLDSKVVQNIYQLIDYHINIHDSLIQMYKNDVQKANPAAFYNELISENFGKVHQNLCDSITKHQSSLAAIFGLYSKFSDKYILDIALDSALFKSVSTSLSKQFSANSHVVWLSKKVEEQNTKNQLLHQRENQLKVGNPFPAIHLQMITNDFFDLSKCEAKYKIIYLWKGSNSGFYKLNPILKNLYKSYPRKFLEIISISYDQDKLYWLNYSRLEQLPWVNLIVDTEISEKINPTNEFPRIFILDSSNDILARDLTKDEIQKYIETLK